MDANQFAELQHHLEKGVPFSLSLYRSVCGTDVNIVEEYCEGRIPDPLRALVGERIDRVFIIQYRLARMMVAVSHIQEQLNRIEAKLSQ